MLFNKKETKMAPMPEAEPAPSEETVSADNPFAEAANELIALADEGALPEGFDLETACGDANFAALLQEYPTAAAVRIYDAEQRAKSAYQDAMESLMEKLNARNALPKSTRPARAIAPTPDYMAMSGADFRALENKIKAAARSGKRITL